MALTDAQLVTIRRQVGTVPTDDVLFETYDRLLDVDAVILEVLELRYADLVRSPAQFAIPGEYSQSTGENIKALGEQLATLGSGTGGPVTFVAAPVPPSR